MEESASAVSNRRLPWMEKMRKKNRKSRNRIRVNIDSQSMRSISQSSSHLESSILETQSPKRIGKMRGSLARGNPGGSSGKNILRKIQIENRKDLERRRRASKRSKCRCCGSNVYPAKDPRLTNKDYTYLDVIGLVFGTIFILGAFFVICVLSWQQKDTIATWTLNAILTFSEDIIFRFLIVSIIEALVFLPLTPIACAIEWREEMRILNEVSSLEEHDYYLTGEEEVKLNQDGTISSLASAASSQGLRIGLKVDAVNSVLVDNGYVATSMISRSLREADIVCLTVLMPGSANLVEIEFDSNGEGFKIDRQLRVSAVMPGSEAEQRGVQIGWKVLYIGEELVHNLSNAETALEIAFRIGMTYTVKFRTNIKSHISPIVQEREDKLLEEKMMKDVSGEGVGTSSKIGIDVDPEAQASHPSPETPKIKAISYRRDGKNLGSPTRSLTIGLASPVISPVTPKISPKSKRSNNSPRVKRGLQLQRGMGGEKIQESRALRRRQRQEREKKKYKSSPSNRMTQKNKGKRKSQKEKGEKKTQKDRSKGTTRNTSKQGAVRMPEPSVVIKKKVKVVRKGKYMMADRGFLEKFREASEVNLDPQSADSSTTDDGFEQVQVGTIFERNNVTLCSEGGSHPYHDVVSGNDMMSDDEMKKANIIVL